MTYTNEELTELVGKLKETVELLRKVAAADDILYERLELRVGELERQGRMNL